MTIKNKRNVASILFVLMSIMCWAQGESLPPPPMSTPPPGLPIDGGVLIGAFVAVCYGVKKLIKNT